MTARSAGGWDGQTRVCEQAKAGLWEQRRQAPVLPLSTGNSSRDALSWLYKDRPPPRHAAIYQVHQSSQQSREAGEVGMGHMERKQVQGGASPG